MHFFAPFYNSLFIQRIWTWRCLRTQQHAQICLAALSIVAVGSCMLCVCSNMYTRGLIIVKSFYFYFGGGKNASLCIRGVWHLGCDALVMWMHEYKSVARGTLKKPQTMSSSIWDDFLCQNCFIRIILCQNKKGPELLCFRMSNYVNMAYPVWNLLSGTFYLRTFSSKWALFFKLNVEFHFRRIQNGLQLEN